MTDLENKLNELRIKDGEDWIGKTISAVYDGSQIVIVFTDGTFAYLSAYEDQWGEDAPSVTTVSEIESYHDLKRIGLVTEEELTLYVRQLDEKRQRNIEQRDRERYEELKRKYEPEAKK